MAYCSWEFPKLQPGKLETLALANILNSSKSALRLRSSFGLLVLVRSKPTRASFAFANPTSPEENRISPKVSFTTESQTGQAR
jgi:hypothetical protein